MKRDNRRIQTTTSRFGKLGKGGCGNQGRGGRGGNGVSGRGTVRRNYDWRVTGLNGCTSRVQPAYRFENYQWFNITEETRMQST